MIEPSNNYWSRLVYKFVGHEPFDEVNLNGNFNPRSLLDSNQALMDSLERDYEKFKKLFPMFSLIKEYDAIYLFIKWRPFFQYKNR